MIMESSENRESSNQASYFKQLIQLFFLSSFFLKIHNDINIPILFLREAIEIGDRNQNV